MPRMACHVWQHECDSCNEDLPSPSRKIKNTTLTAKPQVTFGSFCHACTNYKKYILQQQVQY